MNKASYRNKDTKLSLAARQNLYITASNLEDEIDQRTQVYFHPESSDKLDLNTLNTLQTIVCCAKCKQIPLDLQQCTVCHTIVCYPCQRTISKEAEEKDSQPLCPKCSNKEVFEFTQVKQLNLKEFLKLMTEEHCCEVDQAGFTPEPHFDDEGQAIMKAANEIVNGTNGEESKQSENASEKPLESRQPQSDADPQNLPSQKTKAMTIFELDEHLRSDCKKNRTCQACCKSFDTHQEFHAHLQYVCNSIKIQCNDCDKRMTRRVFKLHDCFVKKTQFKLNIEQNGQNKPENKPLPDAVVVDDNLKRELQLGYELKLADAETNLKQQINAIKLQQLSKQDDAFQKLDELKISHASLFSALQSDPSKVQGAGVMNCKQSMIERCNADSRPCSKCKTKIEYNEYFNYCIGCEGIFHKSCEHPRFDEDFYKNFYAQTQKECVDFTKKFQELINEIQVSLDQ